MKNTKELPLWISWYHSFFVSVLFLLFHGYRFNTGDQEEHLPHVYKMLDPSLYVNDYFMSAGENTFSVRFFYKWVVYFFSEIIGVEAACLVLTLVILIITSRAVLKIAGYFTERRGTGELASLLVMTVFVNVTLGANEFQNNILICSSFSIMFCTLALLQFFRKNYYLVAVFAGIAAWFQVLEAIIFMTVVFPVMYLFFEKRLLILLRYFLIFLIVSSPMLVPVFYHHFINTFEYDHSEYYRALYFLRNPNHYLPSRFLASEFTSFCLFSFAGLVSVFAIKAEFRKVVVAFFVIIVSGMIAYYFLLEHANVMVVGKTQWFKSSVWLTLLFSITISAALTGLFKKFVSMNLVKMYMIISALIILGGVALVLNVEKFKVANWEQKWAIGNHPKTDLTSMHEWIAENTAKDDVFLVSPADQSFLCEAKRSMIIGFKAVIHEPFFMIPWAENYQRIYQFSYVPSRESVFQVEAYHSFNSKMFLPAEGERLDYRIDDLSVCAFADQLGEVIHKEGNLVLTKVR